MTLRARVLHAFSSFQLGGAQSRTIDLIKSLSSDPVDHVITAMDGNFEAMRRLEGFSQVSTLEFPFVKSSGIKNLGAIAKLVEQVNPTTVISYNWGAIEWAMAFLPSSIYRYHVEDGFGPQEVIKRNWKRNLARKLVFRSKPVKLVVVSNTLARIAKQEWGVPKAKTVLLENGVNLQRFELASRNRSTGSPFIVGTVCGLRAEKRIDRLIHAFHKLPEQNSLLKIAGAGSELASLKALVSNLGIDKRVEFCGQVEDIPFFLRQLDCFALSSDTEQAPVSLLEAMATGLPCVTTDVGDAKHMLPDSKKDFAVALTPEAVSACLSQVEQSRLDERNLYRENVRLRFDYADCLSKWQRIYLGTSSTSVSLRKSLLGRT